MCMTEASHRTLIYKSPRPSTHPTMLLILHLHKATPLDHIVTSRTHNSYVLLEFLGWGPSFTRGRAGWACSGRVAERRHLCFKGSPKSFRYPLHTLKRHAVGVRSLAGETFILMREKTR
ncbi:hypothetical protein E2C01_044978 [Portunus trituberculatus]|uniref:Uncharacterized protein n=1 Tax=Portunus trituberculatus TaxID=210409 RepID=A0A5B7G1W6_PORTR|nr:hypothetical protein [Portunus trituberculatus]